MAIKLEVREYCSACLDFEPDVTKPERTFAFDNYDIAVKEIQTDTIIRCRYARRCENIKRFLERGDNNYG